MSYKERRSASAFAYQMIAVPQVGKVVFIWIMMVLLAGVTQESVFFWVNLLIGGKILFAVGGGYIGYLLLRQNRHSASIAKWFIFLDTCALVGLDTLVILKTQMLAGSVDIFLLTCIDLGIHVLYFLSCFSYLQFGKSAKLEFVDRVEVIDPLERV